MAINGQSGNQIYSQSLTSRERAEQTSPSSSVEPHSWPAWMKTTPVLTTNRVEHRSSSCENNINSLQALPQETRDVVQRRIAIERAHISWLATPKGYQHSRAVPVCWEGQNYPYLPCNAEDIVLYLGVEYGCSCAEKWLWYKKKLLAVLQRQCCRPPVQGDIPSHVLLMPLVPLFLWTSKKKSIHSVLDLYPEEGTENTPFTHLSSRSDSELYYYNHTHQIDLGPKRDRKHPYTRLSVRSNCEQCCDNLERIDLPCNQLSNSFGWGHPPWISVFLIRSPPNSPLILDTQLFCVLC